MDFKEYSISAKDTPEQAKFRQEVRDFLDKEVTSKLIEASQQMHGMPPELVEFIGKLGAKGWLFPEWPKEYGGAGLSSVERDIIAEEIAGRGINTGGFYGLLQGPAIMRYGTEEQKREWLPKIGLGKVSFVVGFTEPNAGTDLAALQTRAISDGDDYIINGQKVFSSGADHFTHHWLAVRTNIDVPKHRGISLLIVDRKTPGITIRPMWTMANERTNEVFYDDVRVPKKNRIGEENTGWDIIKEALNLERGAVSTTLLVDVKEILDKLIQYTKGTKRNGRPLSEDLLVRQGLAQLVIETNILRLFNHRVSWLMGKGVVSDWAAAMSKVWHAELAQRVSNIGTQIMGLYGQLEPGSKWAPLKGYIELLYRSSVAMSFGGGSNELMRSVIAVKVMGLPR